MKMKKYPILGLTSIVLAGTMMNAEAITIAHGGDSVDVDFVDIGNEGNTGDTANTYNGANPGAVDYEYSIGTFEVTADQWAVVRGFDARVENNTNVWSGSQPTGGVSWYEAAKFSNWLTSGDALQGAYTFSDSNTFTGVDRVTALTTYGTIYVLPTEDEWYKAAYFKSDGSGYTLYATGNSVPGVETDANYGGRFSGTYTEMWDVGTGGTMDNNGTYDMGGNVREWVESAFDGTLDNPSESRVMRGGNWNNPSFYLQASVREQTNPLTEGGAGLGFRVASISAVPEPSSTALLGLGGLAVLLRRRR